MPVHHKQSRGHRFNKKQVKNKAANKLKREKSEEVSFRPSIKDSLTVANVFVCLFFLSIFVLILEIRPLERTVGALELYLKAGAFGFVLSLVIILCLCCVKYDKVARQSLIIVIGCCFSAPPIASMTNRKLSIYPPYKQQYIVVQKFVKRSGGKRSHQLSILPSHSGRREVQNITMKKVDWDSFSEKETVSCAMHSGLWGFPVIGQIERD